MLNPVVLIATHNRLEITIRNVISLLNQSVKPLIYIVTSDFNEGSKYMQYYGFEVLSYPNHPLGAKWQHGVDSIIALTYPNPLIITGSDDILGDGFIENVCRLVQQGNHFIGLRSWWQHKNGKAYYCQYKVKDNFPLGGGRVYSGEMLKAIDYNVFDPTIDKHLDDLGWYNARKSGLKCLVLDTPEKEGLSIHAIKGDWPVMNAFTIKHKNLILIRTNKGENVLPSFYSK